jgi:hypothetical protein
MSDNPYIPHQGAESASLLPRDNGVPVPETSQNVESAQDKWCRLGITALAWIFIGYGGLSFIGAIVVFSQRLGDMAHSSLWAYVAYYSAFVTPALTIQSGLLLRGRSKWAIATCFSVVVLCMYVVITLSPPLSSDHRSIFRILFEATPPQILVRICSYSLVSAILWILWRAKKLR